MLANDDIMLGSVINKLPVIDMEDKASAEMVEYNIDNIIQYELNSRDSRINHTTCAGY